MPMTRLLVLALSLAAGGGAAWLSTANVELAAPAVAAAPAVTQIVVKPALEDVLVAAADLEQRRRLAPGDLTWQPWPKETVNASYILRSAEPNAAEELGGNLVRVAMLSGEPVRREKVSATDDGYLSALLSPGKRAVSVKITAESTAGGFILPEDRVDVLHTFVPESGKTAVTRTVVNNVRVLAVDQQVAAPEGNAVATAKTATLELDPGQAEIVSASEASGSISLALRSTSDNGETQKILREADRTVTIITGGQSHILKTN